MISDCAAGWLRLAMLRGIGPVTGRRLVAAVGDIDRLWTADHDTLAAVAGIGAQLLRTLTQADAQPARRIIAQCRSHGIGLLCPDDDAWPETLHACDDAPLLLYYRGDAGSLNQSRMLAVIGARRASREGCLIARRWCRSLSDAQVCIVSGMAVGIDAAAHGGALDGDGSTVAVLGCGLLACTAAQQRQIDAIAARGCVISEFMPAAPPRPEQFPRRNRIIAGISHAALIVEADLRSGSLITARQALDYGRELFAVPGSVLGDRHAGCHRLIRDGALLAEQPDEIMRQMGWSSPSGRSAERATGYRPADREEAKLLQALACESMHLDHLAESCGLTVPELSPIVLRLELLSVIERLPGGRYMLSVELHQT